MSEEIRKNAEINDNELEQVSGGNAYPEEPPIFNHPDLEERAPNCPICEVKMRPTRGTWIYYGYICDTCGRTIDAEP